jgi:cysteinyl-tRNA synthetase
MYREIYFYNSYSKKNEILKTVKPNIVGIYSCGPTVYGPPHIGHARSSVTVDIVIRYLRFCGYKVKFIRNYTDVGHLEYDQDFGDDKIEKQAKKEGVDPMEIAQKYINLYKNDMNLLNCISPNVEPQATGYIQEQIDIVKEIISRGFAYEKNGSVYFNVQEYDKKFKKYGTLSGIKIEDLYSQTRDLKKQSEKIFTYDFALWKKADTKHIMKWNSPWGIGFPGWHTECVALSVKYLGHIFDIHFGGIDLKFPHHEAEIAQANVVYDTNLANLWIHNNLVNISNQKMSKSLNNFITLDDLFFNSKNIFQKTFSPNILRFLFLETHYRSTLSLSLNALESAEKGYFKLINTLKNIKEIQYVETNTAKNNNLKIIIEDKFKEFFNDMSNDINTPKVLAHLFDLSKIINDISNSKISVSDIEYNTFNYLKINFINIIEDVLGLTEPDINKEYIEILLYVYEEAKKRKDFEQVDILREKIKKIYIKFYDKENSISWGYGI